jgi:hypothetical protein
MLMSMETTTAWEAVGAVLIATIVLLWVRRNRNRYLAIISAKRNRDAGLQLAGDTGPQLPYDRSSWHPGPNLDKTGNPVSIKGPVSKVGGKFTLLIPLGAGGNDLIKCSRGIAEIEGEDLKVTIPDWLADKMGLEEGSLVHVDNDESRFNITAIEAKPGYTRRN